MSVKCVIDMNLSVEWVEELLKHGWFTVHWASVGDPRASDEEIMEWARIHNYVVFTHDLDFGTMLALTQATAPSVLQVRGQNVLPEDIGEIIATTLNWHKVLWLLSM